MQRSWRIALCSLISIGLFSSFSRAATPEEVDNALKKAIAYIYSKQTGDNWEGAQKAPEHQAGGVTACAIYALLAAGEKPQENPRLAAAIEWMKKAKVTGTYAMGLRTQIWTLIPFEKDPQYREILTQDWKTLLQGVAKGSGYDGMWHYQPQQTSYDHSTAQYGVLGVWGLEKAGAEIPNALWSAIEREWVEDQDRSGGWAYGPKPTADGHGAIKLSMTAAGIATLFITQDYLRAQEGIKCSGNIKNVPIDKGMAWMEKHLPDEFKRGINAYTLYGIERIGVASGYKYFGTVDWYKEGSNQLIKRQAKDGNWGAALTDTCFSIVFLTRGRAPVVMNKLEYDVDGKTGNWNQRPRDAANVTRFTGRQLEKDLNWQIVNLKVDVDELHDSPILYITGNQALKFTAEEEAKLKSFVEGGGLILGHADCADSKFANAFRTLGTKLFKYEFRELSADHPIYTRQQFGAKAWKNKLSVLGLNNGVREVMLLLPTGDPAKAWQLQDDKGKAEPFQLLSNIFLYTNETRDFRTKDVTYLVKPDAKIKPTRSLKLARLEVGDNFNPEPGGWRRLAAILHNTASTTLETVNVKADAANLKDFKVAHLTGTTKIVLTDAQKKGLKDYVTNGGTLVIDAAGGDSEFSESVEKEILALFPDNAEELSKALPLSHPLYQAGGSALTEVTYRQFARTKLPGSQKAPLLRGLTINGRLAVIFSREDLSGGLTGAPFDGVYGYSVNSATELMKKIVLFAGGATAPAPAGTSKPAATQPAKK